MGAAGAAEPAGLLAGVAKVEITDRAGPVHDAAYARALVLKQGDTTVALVCLDVVAVEEIGRLGRGFMPGLRERLQKELGIAPDHVLVNASHCHAVVRADSQDLAFQAVKEAQARLAPAWIGAGTGHEEGISENRRLRLVDGRQADMRRAYALPPDKEVAAVGPIDPEIGLLRIDHADGRPLAVLYQFACHPIMNPPSLGSSADFPGVASQAVEEALGGGALALFVQGCGGDVNPLHYKEPNRPVDATPLGHRLAVSVLKAWRGVATRALGAGELRVARAELELPRAADHTARMAALEAEQARLLKALRPVNLNFKNFLPLLLQQRLDPAYPSHHAQSYLHEKQVGRRDLEVLDADNRAAVEAYLKNIEVMEELTRLATNLALLRKHAQRTEEAGGAPLRVEVNAFRAGDFKLLTFPGELTVEIGLRLKKAAALPGFFVSGYTNGYIYYAPTAAQRLNKGYAQEDCDTWLAPEWQEIFERRGLELLRQVK